MIQHIVALSLVDGFDRGELILVMNGLSRLEIDGFLHFSHGENLDFEGKSEQFDYGFVCSFSHEAAVKEYAADETHQALGARLVAMCRGGVDGIFVMDLKT